MDRKRQRIATFVLVVGISGLVVSDGVEAVESPVETNHIDRLHASHLSGDPFPSAAKCAGCHPDHYREWSVSPHAYAQLSPLFNALANKQIRDTSGTLGDFCTRCHAPIRAAMCESNTLSNLDRHPTSREGVTCVVCHRINQAWGKASGRQSLLAGDIYAPIFGSHGNGNLAAALDNPERYGAFKTEPDPETRGREVHAEVVPFFHHATSGFCGSCHDVLTPTGLHLTDTFSEYKQTSAAQAGQRCQDCHMGKTPGVAEGYTMAPAARIGNAVTPPRKHTNHMLVGPSYSLVHPGIFPHNPDAVRHEQGPPHQTGLATMREWLLFDVQAGWGTPAFEHHQARDVTFPESWQDSLRRFRARKIIDKQLELLGEAERQRLALLRRGYVLGDIQVAHANADSIRFRLQICNGTTGHGVPGGAGKPAMLVYLRTAVLDSFGNTVFLSGDLDPNGDVRDDHSLYVRHGLLPRDRALFSLQTRYLTRNLRGGEREQVLSINYSRDPLPFLRPATRPATVAGRPFSVRRHKLNIEPGGARWARYESPIHGPGRYQICAQLIVGVVPVNLVHEMSSAGFDYGLSAQAVAQRVVDGHRVLHERSVSIVVK